MVKNLLIVLKICNRCNKNCFKRSNSKKKAEATGDLIGNKIADKITSVSTGLHSKNDDANSKIEVPKIDTYLQKKGNKILMNSG